MSGSSRASINILPGQIHNGYSSPSSYTSGRAPSSTLKRRRDDKDTTGLSLEPFEIRPINPTITLAKPTIAYPIRLITRSRLPLAFLDPRHHPTITSSPTIPKTFSSHITSLETEDALELQDPTVLVAKILPEERLYAIERLDELVYSSCKLAHWVTLKHFPESTSRIPPRKKAATKSSITGDKWWTSIALSTPDTDFQDDEVKIKLEGSDDADVVMLGAEEADDRQLATNSDQVEDTITAQHVEEPISQTAEVQVSLEDSFSSICTSYLEMLYLSQAPLAYFAKGPLSRSRAAHARVDGASHNLQDLADSLRVMVMSTTALDKKYKESIPFVVKELASAGMTTGSAVKPLKRRKTKMFKPGKDGLFPEETISIKQWWFGDSSSSALPPTADTLDAAMKTRITVLRVREYLLQLVIILEILAIETSIAKADRKLAATEGELQVATESQPTTDQPPKSVKKPRDLQPLVEIIVDRLTIWQSVNSIETSGIPGDHDDNGEGVDTAEAASGKMRDELKEFCVEVVVPFYASRLGKVAERLARKLGVQTTTASPRKRKPTQKEAPVRPGATLSHDENPRRRQLSRVSTLAGGSTSSRPPSLMRSATDTLLQEIQRERSNSPNINLTSKSRSFSRSTSINHGRRMIEVDLNAHSKPGSDKAKSSVDQELKDAIAALKKPNRGLAVKELADASDSRKLAAQKRPSMAGRTQSQVAATPRRGTKTKDMVSATPGHRTNIEQDTIISSSAQFVPSSGRRPVWTVEKPKAPDFGAVTTKSSDVVAATPSRDGGRHTDSLGIMDAEAIPAQPVFVVPAARSVKPPASRHGPQVPQTPQKARQAVQGEAPPLIIASPGFAVIASSPAQAGTKATGKSIYDSLGWDDEDIL